MRHNPDGYQRQVHLLVLAHAAARELVAWAGGTIHPGESLMSVIDRRQVLASTACAVLLAGTARAVGRTISGALPWEPFDGAPSAPARPRSLAVLHARRSRCARGDRTAARSRRLIGHGRQGGRLRRLYRSPAQRAIWRLHPFISLKFVGGSADRRARSKS
jgi:hypothetical protein